MKLYFKLPKTIYLIIISYTYVLKFTYISFLKYTIPNIIYNFHLQFYKIYKANDESMVYHTIQTYKQHLPNFAHCPTLNGNVFVHKDLR